MLVLKRKVGERIFIGPPEQPYGIVSVEEVGPGGVRLGFEFGPEIEVNREEIAQRAVEASETAEEQ